MSSSTQFLTTKSTWKLVRFSPNSLWKNPEQGCIKHRSESSNNDAKAASSSTRASLKYPWRAETKSETWLKKRANNNNTSYIIISKLILIIIQSSIRLEGPARSPSSIALVYSVAPCHDFDSDRWNSQVTACEFHPAEIQASGNSNEFFPASEPKKRTARASELGIKMEAILLLYSLNQWLFHITSYCFTTITERERV